MMPALERQQPGLPLPPPLRGREEGTFTHYSVRIRLREIARRVLVENDLPTAFVDNMEALIAELPEGPVRPLRDAEAPDAADWERYIAPHVGQNWLQVPWFFAEAYFYRRILEATGFFQAGAGYRADPFAYQKRQGLVAAQERIRTLGSQVRAGLEDPPARWDVLARLLLAALWGNQADLSLWPAGEAGQPDHADLENQHAHLLVEDARRAVAHLAGLDGSRVQVDVLVDNAGFEFVSDLCVADFLLRSDAARRVRLHLKVHPMFVSDAMIKDVHETLAFLAADGHPEVQALAGRLQGALDAGRLQLREHLFFTSPLPFWEMPPALRQALGEADLVISKGDANYRRLLGDRHWDATASFAEIVRYFPAPLLALRTLKSEIVAGLPPGRAEATAAQDPDWLINGRWGVIQFALPPAA